MGPIDSGAELVTRFSSDIPTELQFYTDNNALETRPRQFNLSVSDPIPGNYFPMVGYAYIQGSGADTRRLMLLSDRSHGASSQVSGALEVMLTRRCLQDDGFGVGEILDDTDEIDPSFKLLFDTIEHVSDVAPQEALKQAFPLSPLFATAPDIQAWKTAHTLQNSFLLPNALAANVHLLSFEARADPEFVLLRLQHVYEAGMSAKFSQPATVNLAALFPAQILSIETVEESTLTGNLAKVDLRRLVWQTNSKLNSHKQPRTPFIPTDGKANTRPVPKVTVRGEDNEVLFSLYYILCVYCSCCSGCFIHQLSHADKFLIYDFCD